MKTFQAKHNQIMVVAGTVLYAPVGVAVMWASHWRPEIMASYLFCVFLYTLCIALGYRLKDESLRVHLPMELCFYIAYVHQFAVLHYTQLDMAHLIATIILINAGLVVMGTLSKRHVMILLTMTCAGMFSLLLIPTTFPVLALAVGYLPLLIWAYITAKEHIQMFTQLEVQDKRLHLAFKTSKLTLVNWIEQGDQMVWDSFAPEVLGITHLPRTLSEFLKLQKEGTWTRATFENGNIGEILKERLEIGDRFIQIEGSFVQTRKGKEWTGIARDLTEQVQLQNALNIERARAEASAKLVSLGEMAGGIAHEINNPLTIIQGMMEVLEDAPVLPQAKASYLDNLKKVQKTVTRITHTIKALRMISRDGEREAMREVSVSSLIDDALFLCREKYKSQGVEVVCDAGSAPDSPLSPLMINCNPIQVVQILVNLLNNAFDSINSDPDKENKHSQITVLAKNLGDQTLVTVQDTGPGVPNPLRDRIFEPFFTTKPLGEGTGLGLSISANLMKEHGGKLQLAPYESGKGAVFELVFPHAKT